MVVVVRRRVPDNPRATLRGAAQLPNCSLVGVAGFERGDVGVVGRHHGFHSARRDARHRARLGQRIGHAHRSEEHTSELQSLMRISYAVFCLKKKKQQPLKKPPTTTTQKDTQNKLTSTNTITSTTRQR